MRNVFDQYSHPENRLTHALAVCLDEDRRLLDRFLAWIGIRPPSLIKRLTVSEQALPGERPISEENAERKGLPDIVIHSSESWALFVESKIEARLTDDQLLRH